MSSIGSAGECRRTHGQRWTDTPAKPACPLVGIASDASARVLTAAPQAAPQAIEEMSELKLLTFKTAPL
jgi:hypothetical protein